MKIDNIGYNYSHDSVFYISRPNGSEDYLFLLFKTPAVVQIFQRPMSPRYCQGLKV
jgi:hypothetical protein